MIEPSGDLDLGEKALITEDGAELGPQHLEGDLAVVLEVGGQIDGRHPAGAQRAFDAVAITECGGEADGVGVHGVEDGASRGRTEER